MYMYLSLLEINMWPATSSEGVDSHTLDLESLNCRSPRFASPLRSRTLISHTSLSESLQPQYLNHLEKQSVKT